MMLDKRSRKILRSIKRKGQYSFKEITKRSRNPDLAAVSLVRLNSGEYIIRIVDSIDEKNAKYEMQDKGYAVLEEFAWHVVLSLIPILISVGSFIVSIIALLKSC